MPTAPRDMNEKFETAVKSLRENVKEFEGLVGNSVLESFRSKRGEELPDAIATKRNELTLELIQNIVELFSALPDNETTEADPSEFLYVTSYYHIQPFIKDKLPRIMAIINQPWDDLPRNYVCSEVCAILILRSKDFPEPKVEIAYRIPLDIDDEAYLYDSIFLSWCEPETILDVCQCLLDMIDQREDWSEYGYDTEVSQSESTESFWEGVTCDIIN